MGNPHAIFWVDDVDAYDLAQARAAAGAPSDLSRARQHLAARRWRRASTSCVRTWERGAGLTRACGSAACAAAVAAARLRRTGRTVTVTLPGGDLRIEWRERDDHVLMTGPVAYEYEGRFDPALFAERRRGVAMSVDVVTFGCRLNAYESEVIRREARAAGLADTVVVNTCAVTAEAVRQARQAIRRLKRERPAARIVVTGCAAQTEPATLRGHARGRPASSATRRSSARRSGARTGRAARAPFGIAAEEKVVVNDIMAVTRDRARISIDGVEGRARAFVQVQNGCDHRCTFCIIPYGRGNSRSVPMGEVVAQVRTLVRARLSRGRAHRRRSHELRRESAGRAEARHAGEADPQARAGARAAAAVLDRFGRGRSATCSTRSPTSARLMPHLHLSLQAGDDLILKRMKRRHLRADAIAFCRAGAPAAARRGVRRRHHRRLPDRDRGDVRALARSGRRMRPDASARLSVLAAAGHAAPRACRRLRARRRQGARAPAARKGEAALRAPSRCARSARTRSVLTESQRHRPHRAFHAGAARCVGRARRDSRPHRRRARRTATARGVERDVVSITAQSERPP